MMAGEMKRKRNRGHSKYFISWKVLTILTMGLFVVNLSSNYAVGTKERTMNLASQTVLASIPPIDAAPPPTIETASFGLG